MAINCFIRIAKWKAAKALFTFEDEDINVDLVDEQIYLFFSFEENLYVFVKIAKQVAKKLHIGPSWQQKDPICPFNSWLTPVSYATFCRVANSTARFCQWDRDIVSKREHIWVGHLAFGSKHVQRLLWPHHKGEAEGLKIWIKEIVFTVFFVRGSKQSIWWLVIKKSLLHLVH